MNALFIRIDHAHFRNVVRYLGNRFDKMQAEIRDGLALLPSHGIEDLAHRVLPKDDSSLQWSPVSGGFSENLADTAREIFARFVERYTRSGESPSRSDEDIAKPFRARLEQKQVSGRVRPKRIEAKDYEYDFHYAWKNAIRRLYEPVSFDLVDPGSIVEKANRCLGRGVALQDPSEKFKIHFLLSEPKRAGAEKAFKNARHLLEKIPGEIELVREDQMEAFAESVAAEIAGHGEASN